MSDLVADGVSLRVLFGVAEELHGHHRARVLPHCSVHRAPSTLSNALAVNDIVLCFHNSRAGHDGE